MYFKILFGTHKHTYTTQFYTKLLLMKEGISHYYVEIYLLLILHALQVMIRYDMIMFVSIIRIYPLKAEVFCKMIYDALLMILLSLITIDKLQDFFFTGDIQNHTRINPICSDHLYL